MPDAENGDGGASIARRGGGKAKDRPMVEDAEAKSTGTAAPVTCPACDARSVCIGNGADEAALRQLNEAVEKRFAVAAGDYLYRNGDPFKSLYAVHTGCLMHSMRDARGREQVMGFHMTGDVVGVAGIEAQTYLFDMRALERSDVCELPFDKLEDIAARVPALRQNIVRIFGRYRNRDAMTQSLRRSDSAGARLAGFLLDFSRRAQARGFAPSRLRLPMSDAELASYLGLGAAEVEQEFARLGGRGIATLSGRMVSIADIKVLQSLAAAGA
jgi:CRP/FNR family transcriptional regulator, anaerobic regulatory protein